MARPEVSAAVAELLGHADPLVTGMLAHAVTMPKAAAVSYLRRVLSDTEAELVLDLHNKYKSAKKAHDVAHEDGAAVDGVGDADEPQRKRRRGAPQQPGGCDAPWTPVAGYGGVADVAASLTAELAHFEAFVDLTPEECAAREDLLRRVSTVVEASIGTHARCLAFGSLAAGLATYESDIDIGVHVAEDDTLLAGRHPRRLSASGPGVSELRQLAHGLKGSRWARDVELRGRARVPIVTLVDAVTGVAVDVGGAAGRSEGEATTRVVRHMSERWPQLFRPMLLFLKVALSEAELNKPFTGGLGSFKLSMLLCFFLDHLGAHNGAISLPSSGACLLAFLRFVAHQFDFTDTEIEFMGVRADFQSVFSWPSVANWAAAALQSLQRPVSSPLQSRLVRLVDAERLESARARSIALAAAATAAAATTPVRGASAARVGTHASPIAQRPMLRPAPPMPATPTSLHVFDLDGTLLQTFGPQDGRAALLAMGVSWPHKSWWNHPGSLAPPLPARPGPALQAYMRAAEQPGAVLALLSGRRRGLEQVVNATLAAVGAPHAPHLAFYGPDNEDATTETTLNIKSRAMHTLLTRFTLHVRQLHIYEDRAAHAAQLRAICERMCPPHVAWEVHFVGTDNGDANIASPGPSPLQAPRPPLPPAAAAPSVVPRLSCAGGYVRLTLLPPVDPDAIPPLWRAAKEARDGVGDFHVTLLNRGETAQYAQRMDIAFDVDVPGGDAALEARILAALHAHSGNVAAADAWAHMEWGGVGVVADAAQGTCAAFMTIRDWPAGRAFRASLDLPARDFHVTLGFIGADVHDVPKGKKTELRGVAGLGAAGLRRAIAQRADVLLAGGASDDDNGQLFTASDTHTRSRSSN